MRYKVFYRTDSVKEPEDYAICYGESYGEAEAHFLRYNPEREITRITPFKGLREMASEGDEHEFLTCLLEAIEDQELETTLTNALYNRGYGRDE